MLRPQRAVAAETQTSIDMARQERSLADAVVARSGTNFKACYHCQACAGGCPFVKAMDYPPNAVLRLLQYGMTQEALTCKTI
jgi:heterodisulfide reductase subunit C